MEEHMVANAPGQNWKRTGAAVRRALLPVAALAGLVALSGCYYGPYYPYGYYGYPGYGYAAPPVVGGVFVGGAYGYHRYRYWR